MQIVVHGGAGSDPKNPTERRQILEDAADAGAAETEVVDAVVTAVSALESSPRFNAGVGSAVQSDGKIRTDAGIMTDERSVGAVCSMEGVERAGCVARIVMEETPHTFVSGDHAVDLAEAFDVEVDADLWTDRTREKWDALEAPVGGAQTQLEWIDDRFGETDPGGRGESDVDDDSRGSDDEHDHDTVGAVACDDNSLAAATSTGGRWLALAGRVGDVPQVGAGFYCSPAAAVSATGAGEDIARTTLSRRVGRHVERGLEADAAAELAIGEFAELTGSTAGVIVVDARGHLGSAYNSDAMQTAKRR